MTGLYTLFNERDLALVELNPLAILASGDLMALDGKVNSDDNAEFRHPKLAAMRDLSQEDAAEAAAVQHNLNYVTMDGNIGCMVNGAGLAMATMDVIKLAGGEPANFLDVGGGATKERVTEAFKLILSSDKVKAILVNIFGGIVRCDLIAEGIIAAVKEVGHHSGDRAPGRHQRGKGPRIAGQFRPCHHPGRRSERCGAKAVASVKAA
jgi:succinyl-CoA synthetase beta subunit